jgi:hypothetical protein
VLNQVEVRKMIGRESAGLPVLSFMALNFKRLVKLLTAISFRGGVRACVLA